MRLKGRVALVTGGAQGIGEGVVRRFVAEGARVALCDVSEAVGRGVAAELGDAVRFVCLDVTSAADWAHAVDDVEKAFAPINILVNNAGRGGQEFVESVPREAFEASLALNLTGALLGMQAAIPSLRRSGNGVILNISSLQGLEADVGLTAYVAGKFGVRGITKSAALELGRDGIRCNSIHPGMIRTPALGGDYLKDDFFGHIPLRPPGSGDRGGRPAHIGGVAAFLASDDAAYITGAEFVVDGAKSVRFAEAGAFGGSFL